METSLHRSLKQLYAPHGSRTEAAVRGYRADVLCDGLVVEIQASPLGAIARKVADLVRHTPVLIVKPITHRKFIVWQGGPDSPDTPRRLSPKRGKLLDVFDDLVRFTRVFPHPKLSVEVVLVDEEEVREPRRRRSFRPSYRLADRKLVSIVATHRLCSASDLLALLPADLPASFTTDVLAQRLGGLPVWFAQRVAYTLRHCGATRLEGKIGNRLVYEVAASRQEQQMMVAC